MPKPPCRSAARRPPNRVVRQSKADRRSSSRCARVCAAIIVSASLLPSLSLAAESAEKTRRASNESRKATSTVPPGRCVSQGGQWPPFWLHGKLPRRSPKGGAQELTHCRVYKDRTCCGRDNSDHALVSTRRLVVGGEPTDDCIAKWEALQCATCHPLIGTQHGPPAICDSFCNAIFSACGAAFFAADGSSQHIFPCGRRDTLCARLDSFASSGRQFCQLAGFDWLPDSHGAGVERRGGRGEEMGGREGEGRGERFCFDGTLTAAASKARGGHKGGGGSGEKGGDEEEEAEEGSSGWWEQWVGSERGRPFGGNVVWLVCGLVLTAGLTYLRWVGARSRRRRAAMFALRRVEARARQQQQQAEGVRARQQQQLTEAVGPAAPASVPSTAPTPAHATVATTTARSSARQSARLPASPPR
ncbi:hypothetical protein CLOM_g21920 [Closterium sp. NIES-68]|nr:hypothetical protein CLOM_g21920 [Closterium sp. NIES-68]